MQRSKAPRTGPEAYILGLALLVPLTIGGFALAQLPGTSFGLPSTLVYADSTQRIVTQHPAPPGSAPPPTLAVPAPTPKPSPTEAVPTSVPTAVPTAQPTATVGTTTYTVQRGDELKHIAAQYGVSIWKIISANDIPNPDSLRVGQVLTIPAD